MTSFVVKYFSRKKTKEPDLRFYVEDYDRSYTIPMKVLKGIGLRLMKKDSVLASTCWGIYYWFEFMNQFVPIWLEVIKVAQTARAATSGSLEELVSAFRMVPCIGYMPLGLTKTYKMKRNPLMYENMITELRQMFPRGAVTEEEHKIVKSALTRLNYVNKGYYWWNNVSLFIFLRVQWALGYGYDVSDPAIRVLVEQRYYWWNNVALFMFLSATYQNGVRWALGYDVQPIFPFEYWYPFDPTQSGLCFMTILNIQIWQAVISIWFSMCGDLLFCTFLTHITMQFDLLAVRIKRFIYVPVDDQLISGYPLGRYSTERLKNDRAIETFTDEMWDDHNYTELKDIIRRQHDLIRLAADVEDMYSFSMIVHFFNSSIIICFCTFCSALVEKWNELSYKAFLFVALSESLLLCWYGQRLLESSAGISEAVYNNGWYKASVKIKNSILIMIVRAQKPLYITTYGFSVISLTTYTTLIKTAWSYFTLLLNLYKMQ